MHIANRRVLSALGAIVALPLLLGAEGGCEDDGAQGLDEAATVETLPDSSPDPRLGIFGFSADDYVEVQGCEPDDALLLGIYHAYDHCYGDDEIYLGALFDERGLTAEAEVGLRRPPEREHARFRPFIVGHILPRDAEQLGKTEIFKEENGRVWVTTERYMSQDLASANGTDGIIDVAYRGSQPYLVQYATVTRSGSWP